MQACILEKIREFKSELSGRKILVALSGGSDSVCLLHALYSLKNELCLSLCAVHINHGIRGAEADADEAFSADLCKELNIPVKVYKCDVISYAREKGKSEEEAARELRYRHLFEGKEFFGADLIATAHNKNDQAETVLMRLFKKSSSKGLSGIHFLRIDGVIRPIIACEKQEIMQYLKENGLSYCTDKTNADEKYLRNNIRHSIMPCVLKTFPNAADALFEVAKISDSENEALMFYAKKELYANLSEKSGGYFIKADFFSCPIPIILRGLNILAGEKFADTAHINQAEMVASLVKNEKTGKKVFLKNAFFLISYNGVLLSAFKEKTSFSCEAFLGKELYIKEIDTKVLLSAENGIKKGDLYIKMPTEPFNIVVRSRKEGDRFSPKGLSGTKKLKDYFIDKKVPQEMRDNIPLIVINGEIAYVAGFGPSQAYTALKETEKVIKIEIKK